MERSGLTTQGINQPFPQGVGDQLGRRMCAGLGHHVGAVAVHGLGADAKRCGDLPIGSTGNDKVEDLPLPIGQIRAVGSLFQHGKVTRADNPRTLQNSRDRSGQFGQIIRFAKDPVSPGIDDLGNLAGRGNAGKYNHPGFGRPAARFEQHFRAPGMRHGYIQHQQVRPMLANCPDRLDSVLDLFTNIELAAFERIGIAQCARQSVSDDCMIIGDNRGVPICECHACNVTPQ